jgi:hypothetical protein
MMTCDGVAVRGVVVVVVVVYGVHFHTTTNNRCAWTWVLKEW